VGVAVNVTGSPAQIVVADAAMVILTGNIGLTVMVIVFEVTVAGTTQDPRFEVIVQVILSTSTGV
jgi:hypothetical protein